MRRFGQTILKLLLLTILSVGTVACHSSRKTVRGSSGTVPPRKVDYKEMRDEVNSRDYDVPLIGSLIEEAARWLGVPYKYAGNDRGGVDCSGLTSQVFLKTLNVKMPRSSREQQEWCHNISKSDLMPGDLVFFATGSDRNRVSHVGIYIGNGDMIHASSSRGVVVSNLGETYYTMRYHSSGRPEAIKKLYADQSKKKGKSSKTATPDGSNQRPTTVPTGANSTQLPTPNTSATTPAITVPAISVENLIEQQVDSIADSITDAPITPSTPISTPTQPDLTQPTHSTPQLPTPTEHPDTIFTQFFD